ncbi:MAG: hypothetical protein QGG01_04960, partial [Roseibacillus sp.]|nr:hypothetical protein [Roseibacillus sp.]
FTGRELDYLEKQYRRRACMIADLVPWDDPNYALDEEWAWFHPYASEAKAGEHLEIELRLWNHSGQERTFEIRMEETDGLKVVGKVPGVTLAPRATATVKVPLAVNSAAGPGVRVITASLRSRGIAVDHWIETLVKVSE